MNFYLPPIKSLKGEVPALTPDELKEYNQLTAYLGEKKKEWGENYPIFAEMSQEYERFCELYSKLRKYADFKLNLINQIENN